MIEVVLTVVALLVGLGAWVRSNPIQLDPVDEPVARAEADEGVTESDVLVVLPEVAEATSLGDFTFDHAWLNAVEQEIGQVRMVRTTEVSRAVLDPCDQVIIPRAAAAQLDPTQTQFVRNWIEDGGVLLLEQPEGPWQSLTGQSFTGARTRDTRRLTSFDGAASRGEIREDILETPLRTTTLVYNPPTLARGRDYQVLLEVDGQPGVVHRAIGRGHLILVLLDVGRFLTLSQQGRPEADLTAPRPAESNAPDGWTTSEALVLDPAFRTGLVPWADLFERNLLYLMDAWQPVGRLWMYPGSHRGALLVTHSDDGFGQRVEYMTTWEHDREERSTIFAAAGSMTPEGLARLARLGADVQLGWVPAVDPTVPQRTWGLRAFQPITRAMTLAEQRAALNNDLRPYGPTRAVRITDGLWPTDWLAPWRIFDGNGVELSTSLGPVDPSRSDGEASVGYLFGTGYPFRPIDTNGERFDVYELPTVLLDAAPGYDVARTRRMIFDSAEAYHTVLTGDWRPDTMVRRPSFDALEGWRAAFELARSQELWVTTVHAWADFVARRSESRVRSSFSREERRLAIEARVVGPTEGDEDAIMLTPGVAFPTRFDGRPVERLIVDGFATDPGTLAQTGDRVLHILPLEPGEHRIQVFYGSPIDAGLDDDDDDR